MVENICPPGAAPASVRTLNRRSFAAAFWAEKVRSRGVWGSGIPQQVLTMKGARSGPMVDTCSLFAPTPPATFGRDFSKRGGKRQGRSCAVSIRKQGQAEPLSHPRATSCSGVMDDPGRRPGAIHIGSLNQRRTDGCDWVHSGSAPQTLWIAPRSFQPAPRQKLQSDAG